jgi:hypothetical protein
MRCQECELLLADAEADALVEGHLRGCAPCRALQEDLRANALALSALRDDELPRVQTPERRSAVPRPAVPRHVPWIAAAAAAVLLALIAHQASQPRPVVIATPRAQHVAAPAQLAPEPVPKLAVRHKLKPAPRGAPLKQPLLVKMLTPDPDVVVYWLVD